MKVYVLMDDRFFDPDAVFSKKRKARKAIEKIAESHRHHYSVYRYKLDAPDEPWERIL